ncbi:hypothetical protein DL771_008459 [Monosporascus sp. 5C6A]|nr:hypothetical protein DL771_008459 [Monosporascus sp. 5C6A]
MVIRIRDLGVASRVGHHIFAIGYPSGYSDLRLMADRSIGILKQWRAVCQACGVPDKVEANPAKSFDSDKARPDNSKIIESSSLISFHILTRASGSATSSPNKSPRGLPTTAPDPSWLRHRRISRSDTDFSHAGRLRRRNTRVGTTQVIKHVENFDARPGWKPGSEPGVDTSKPDGGHASMANLRAQCQITIVDFSEDDIVVHELDNDGFIEFLKTPQPTWKLVHIVDPNGELEDSISGKSTTGLLRRLTGIVAPKAKSSRSDMTVENGDTTIFSSGAYRGSQQAGNAGAAGREPLRTLHSYHASPNTTRTEFMEKHSVLASRKLAVAAEQVSIFLTPDNTVIAFFENSADDVEGPILTPLSSPSTILRQSCDASMVGQAIIDLIIDMAIPVQAAYSDVIGDIEMDVLTRPDLQQSKDLYMIVSEITKMRSFIQPTVNVINAMRDHKSGAASREQTAQDLREPTKGVLITPLTCIYLGDMLDHCVLINDDLWQTTKVADGMIDLIFNTIAA